MVALSLSMYVLLASQGVVGDKMDTVVANYCCCAVLVDDSVYTWTNHTHKACTRHTYFEKKRQETGGKRGE